MLFKPLKSAACSIAIALAINCCTAACQSKTQTPIPTNPLPHISATQQPGGEPTPSTTQSPESGAVQSGWQQQKLCADGKLDINIDAAVYAPAQGALATYVMEEWQPSQQQLEKMVDEFFGHEAALYSPDGPAIEQLEYDMAQLKSELDKLESNDFAPQWMDGIYITNENKHERIEAIRGSIANYQRRIDELPDEPNARPYTLDATQDNIYAEVREDGQQGRLLVLNTGIDRCISFERVMGYDPGAGQVFPAAETAAADLPGLANTTKQNAIEQASDLLPRMGIDGFQPDYVGICSGLESAGAQSTQTERFAYGVSFTRSVDGIRLGRTAMLDNPAGYDDNYAPLQQESLHVVVNDGGIMAFGWYFAIQAKGEAEASPVLPAEQAQDIVAEQLESEYTRLLGSHDAGQMQDPAYKLEITELRLEYAAIRQGDQTLLCPVWNVYGTEQLTARKKNQDGEWFVFDSLDGLPESERLQQAMWPVLSINAQDGSVVYY